MIKQERYRNDCSFRRHGAGHSLCQGGAVLKMIAPDSIVSLCIGIYNSLYIEYV